MSLEAWCLDDELVYNIIDEIYSNFIKMATVLAYLLCFFFFSSRRRHTRCSRDWSSDVCSSDLKSSAAFSRFLRGVVYPAPGPLFALSWDPASRPNGCVFSIPGMPSIPYRGKRSEERRVGKECRSRWSPYH